MHRETSATPLSLLAIIALVAGCAPSIVGHRIQAGAETEAKGVRVTLTRQPICEETSGRIVRPSGRPRQAACGEASPVNARGGSRIATVKIDFPDGKAASYEVGADSSAVIPWPDLVQHLPDLDQKTVNTFEIKLNLTGAEPTAWKLYQFKSKLLTAELERARTKRRQDHERIEAKERAEQDAERQRKVQELARQTKEVTEAAKTKCRNGGDLSTVAAHLQKAWKSIDQLRAAMPERTISEDRLRSACLRQAPRFVHESAKFIKANNPYDAISFATLALRLDPDVTSTRNQLSAAKTLLAHIAPTRIKTVAAYTEGSSLVSYFSLANRRGELTAASGTVTLEVALLDQGHTLQICHRAQHEVKHGQFQITTVGVGAFARKSLLYQLPAIDFADFDCTLVSQRVKRGGMAALQSLMDHRKDLALRVLFVTPDGRELRADDTFRP